MIEHDNVKSCVIELYELSKAKQILRDFKAVSLQEYQELIEEQVINLSDLLGISHETYLK